MAQEPIFVSTDVQTVLNEIIQQFETTTGRTLQPAQVERLVLNVLAYREQLVREAIQYSATQNLVSFADGLALDALAELVGVTRLPASVAACTLTFTIVEGASSFIIPSGTRVSSNDGKVVFTTLEDAVVNNVLTLDIASQCSTAGLAGNGYEPGQITKLLDPLAFVESVSNMDTTGGGADQEDDDSMRERVKIAPSRYSNAGSRAAYEFFARSANPGIVDVSVISPDPGVVQIYPLMGDTAQTPQSVLDQVYAACNSDKVRPLTDMVEVLAPDVLDYTIEMAIVYYKTADPTIVLEQVQLAIDAFVLERRKELGRDVLASQLLGVAMGVSGVYNVTLNNFTDLIVTETQVTNCTGTAIYIDTENDG